MTTYAAALVANRPDERGALLVFTAAAITADSEAAALVRALILAESRWPRADGWQCHQAEVVAVAVGGAVGEFDLARTTDLARAADLRARARAYMAQAEREKEM